MLIDHFKELLGLNNMDNLVALQKYINYFQTVSDFLERKTGRKALQSKEESEYKQMVYEVCDLLKETFGGENAYAFDIINVYINVRGEWGSISLHNVHEILGLLRAAYTKLQRSGAVGTLGLAPDSSSYVDPSRLEQLKKIKSNSFDLVRLIRMCEELNTVYQHRCYMAVVMLVRGILDHVPPIFSTKTFGEIANNYSGSKSFKDAMHHLENFSRKVADSYLHEQIRKKESLPTATQVNFSPQIDLLLAEIVRLLAGDAP
ncbi:MAG: hypothetical protein KAS46_05570 [Candidatus Aureabacteria bacterium]|nr:hypothetical protein [Candidatus Auribacterota bacterium]